MPKQDIAQTTSQKDEPKNINIGDFFKLTRWVLRTVYKTFPRIVPVHVTARILVDLEGILSAFLISRILDRIISVLQGNEGSLSVVYPYMGVLVGLSLVNALLHFVNLHTERIIQETLRPKIDEMMYTKIRELGIQTMEDPVVTNKANRADSESYALVNCYFRFVTIFSILVSLGTSTFLVIKTAPEIIPLILVLSLPSVIVDKHFIKKIWKFGYDNTEERRKSYTNAGKLLDPAQLNEIFLSGSHNFLSSRFISFVNWYYKIETDIRKRWFFSTRLLGFLANLGVYSGYLIVFSKLLLRRITVGDALFNVRLIDRISGDVGDLVGRVSVLYELVTRLYPMYDFLTLEPYYKDGELIVPKFETGPNIQIESVNFTYPGGKGAVLDNLNLNIKSGEKVAIVGHNGAGKTTLVKLLCRLYPVSSGRILINDLDVNDLNSSSYYKNLGVLFQDYNTYSHLNVRENIVIGDPDVDFDEEKVLDALKKADALDFVNSYENKLDQVLSERYTGGIRPSSGQWQKLAIARFFYRNAPFVIFDEPTAAIDAISEYNIFNKIYEFFEGKTVIIISHRFSTVRNADRIVVMENGKIIEQGTHDELMKKDGYYAKSFRLQAEGYSSEPVESIV